LQEHLHYSSVALGIYIALLHALGTLSQPVLGLLSDRFGRKTVLLPSCLLLGLFFALLAVAGSNVQAATYGLTSLITQLVVIPAPMITGYLIGGLGIKFAFVLAG